MSLSALIGRQNRDGGWPYKAGSSWTEPTVYALMVACAEGADGPAVERGFRWLAAQQRHDGGWAPKSGVEESTWVTALPLLLPFERIGAARCWRAVDWLLGMTGEESRLVYRLREFLLGNSTQDPKLRGWPWFPGTAAWVVPTAFSILALQKVYQRNGAPALKERVDWGRRFLLSRMCREGGWNHGSVNALGYDSAPYPETTGLALLALHGDRSPHLPRAIATAEKFLADCRSSEGVSWLQMALLAHGRLPGACDAGNTAPCRTVRDQALLLLAGSAARGRNMFTG